MEHRLLHRKQICVQVEIISKGQPIATAHVVDMTQHGVCLAHPPLKLMKGQLVNLSFPVPGDAEGHKFHVPAQVIHSQKQLTGVMLMDDERLQAVIDHFPCDPEDSEQPYLKEVING